MLILLSAVFSTLCSMFRSRAYSQLDRQCAAVVIERPAGQFTPRASHFNGKISKSRQGMPRMTFRVAARDALCMARQQGALVDPTQWPSYFRG
jgi:hypothetical protein